MGARPWIKIYRKKPKGQRINYKEDEVGALWYNTRDDGTVYLSGKLGKKDGNQVEVIAYIEDENGPAAGEPAGGQPQPRRDDDIPF